MSIKGDGFASHRVELTAGPIHYREKGTGEPLVFVHGFGVHGGLWTETAGELAGEHRCIVPDLPFGSHPEPMNAGADLSPTGAARLIADFLAALDLEGVTIVANDSGGAISQILVTEHPERVGRLVLTNCDCFENFPPRGFKLLARVIRLPGAGWLLAQSMRLGAIRRLPLAYGALTIGRIDDALLESWVRPQIADPGVRRDAKKFFGSVRPRYTLAAAEKLPQLRIPALMAWGERDRFFPIEDAHRLAALIPDSRVVAIADAVTFVSLEQPQRLASEIASFVAEKPAAAAGVNA